MRRELSANKAQALLGCIRPADDVGRVRVHIGRGHLADICALDARIKYIGTQIAALVTASGTGLTGLSGIGPVIAGRILAEVGDVARFTTKDTFASYNGTAPIDVSSGAAQSTRADHLRPRRRRGLHPPHRQPAHARPDHHPGPTPPGTEGFIALDWKDGRLVGIEILDASTRLHHDLIDEAESNS